MGQIIKDENGNIVERTESTVDTPISADLINGRIADLQNQQAALNAQVANLQSQIDAYNAQIAEINALGAGA
jgi:peptidoglycan hydrolase CwlO-like protein